MSDYIARIKTPPAQEAEPVAEVVAFGCGVAVNFVGGIGAFPIGTKLYTHAPSDKLRQAAEAALDWWETDGGNIEAILKNLRTALEGK